MIFYEYIIQLYGCLRDNLQQKTNTQIIEDLPSFIFIFHLILGSSLFSYMSQSHQWPFKNTLIAASF
jgi:hypothetical protein